MKSLQTQDSMLEEEKEDGGKAWTGPRKDEKAGRTISAKGRVSKIKDGWKTRRDAEKDAGKNETLKIWHNIQRKLSRRTNLTR